VRGSEIVVEVAREKVMSLQSRVGMSRTETKMSLITT
jgi:hypothetical protein